MKKTEKKVKATYKRVKYRKNKKLDSTSQNNNKKIKADLYHLIDNDLSEIILKTAFILLL